MTHETIGKLAVWSHEPEGMAKGRVLLIHGISEHSGRHLNTVKALTASGYAVVRFDLRGAGLSGGRRQWVEKFSDYVDDTASVYRWICRKLEPLPLFLMGHSLGGAVALHFIVQYQKAFRGLILSAPAFRTGNAISPAVVAIGRKLVHFIPTLKVPGSRDKGAISRDPAVVQAFLEDPLCCHTNTLNQGNEVLNAMAVIPEFAAQVEIPTLIVHGTHDKLIRMEGSYEILRAMPARDKTLLLRPGVFHESHNDLGKEDYFISLTQWLDRHV